MAAPLSPQQSSLLALVPADGSTIGNTSLREQLGWDETTYAAVRDELAAAALLEKGKGRGGSVKRVAVAAPKTELFAAEEIESVIPALERARRASAETAAAKKEKAPAAAAPFTEHRHAQATRKNLPAAGDALGHVEEAGKITFAYDPHRPPVLRFNEGIVGLRELLDESRRRPLTVEETEKLAAFLEAPQPWLEWTGKRETPDFAVEPVALHIHERVSAQAILKAVRREDIQRDLFAEGAQSAKEARAYYQHDVAWANRLITGDSLQVMTSLARREGLAGQVQMMYFDPPYGIKFSSNWQNEVGKRDVKDKDEDLTREPEMIRAYRDTWTLGVHSYLAYLKQRLIVARELLKDSGSIFVQISDENLHRVRVVMDEVFGAENFITTIVAQKKGHQKGGTLEPINDYLLWFAKDRTSSKMKFIFKEREGVDDGETRFSALLSPVGDEVRASDLDKAEIAQHLAVGWSLFASDPLTSGGEFRTQMYPISYKGKTFATPRNNSWKISEDGMARVILAERVVAGEGMVRFRKFLTDFSVVSLTNLWTDAAGSPDKLYVVQTATKIVQRCMLMTTEPGDLVLDPTCGSGSTAYVAEQWGRRWITIDSSRVAVAIARQRLLTACYDTYKTKDPVEGVDPSAPQNPAHGFYYKTVPHITLKSIAQNKGLDPIFTKHEPILAARLAELNAALAAIAAPQATVLRQKLVAKLLAKHVAEGASAVTDADHRRCLLPGTDKPLIQPGKKITDKQAKAYQAAIPLTATWRE